MESEIEKPKKLPHHLEVCLRQTERLHEQEIQDLYLSKSHVMLIHRRAGFYCRVCHDAPGSLNRGSRGLNHCT